jgi:protein-S-isoprenylcysteine O-methyltransferase Ste14
MLFLFVALGFLLFVPVGTIYYWEAWLYLAFFFIPTIAITLYLMKNDPNLLEKRVEVGSVAEKERTQKIIQSLASLVFISMYIVSALDHRYGWSNLPIYLVAAGYVMEVAGFLIVFYVFRENTYTSATIDIQAGQKVISTGPYALVRHPMYSGGLLLLLGTPLGLGFTWALILWLPMLAVIIMRLLDEEKLLLKNLLGYREYCDRVRSRLIPNIY